MQESGAMSGTIFLVGPRAAGKTTVGRALAATLGCPFADTDLHLRESLGLSVAEVVAAEGWKGFRARESAALRELAARYAASAPQTSSAPRGAVIATGGGMVLAAENRRFMREQGTVFYLAAPAQALAARLSADPQAAQRPSLTGLAPTEEAARILAERQPLYEDAAHYTLDATARPEEICAQVLRLLRLARRHSPDQGHWR